ncbi:MAG: hypothetical protein QNK37_37240 [Acidobacteriota bacterium]|nr:hypothetical protein [Acidobacteriota bacterium]
MIKKILLTLSLLGVMTLGLSQFLMAIPQFTYNGCGGCCPEYLGTDSNYACDFRPWGDVDCYYVSSSAPYAGYIVTYHTSMTGCLW